MAEGIYTSIRRKPLSPSSPVQLLPNSGSSLLGNEKLQGTISSTTGTRENPDYKAVAKTSRLVHGLRAATVAFTLLSLGFTAWICYFTHLRVENWTHSTVVGGDFTQMEAKFIDFITSAIVAPLTLAVFNYVVFRIARACVIEAESKTRPFSLSTLVEIGTTAYGSYDPFKITTLLATSNIRVVLLSIAAFSSAVSFSTLTNVIAYEAFQTSANDLSSISLDYLYRPPGQSALQKEENALATSNNQMPSIPSKDLLSKFTVEYIDVITALSFTTAQSLLDNSSYIGINVTNASLSAVPSNINKLFDVPAYQLTYTCTPASAHDINIVNLGLYEISLSLDLPKSPPNTSFSAITSAGPATMNGIFANSAFVAFRPQSITVPSQGFYLGVMNELLFADGAKIDSAFGPIQPTLFNNTGGGGMAATYMYGVACEIYHRTGTVDLSRPTNSTGGTWEHSSGSFANNDSDDLLSLIMPDLQWFPNFVSPVPNVMPGIGGALAASTNVTAQLLPDLDNGGTYHLQGLDLFADNYLYMEGEARRIAYEIAQSAPGQQLSTFYKVQAAGMTLRYRIMFVPWILLVGLISMSLAGVCVIVLIFLARRSTSSRTGRVVRPIRLIADAVAGSMPREEFQQVSSFTDQELDKWGNRFKVRYDYTTNEENGRIIKLLSVGPVAWISHGDGESEGG